MASSAIACSWSGGKDSCLALYRLREAGFLVRGLVTMFTEDGQRSRSHGLHRSVLEAQAAALGLPLLSRSATWENYETECVSLLKEAREQFQIEGVVFGDIDIAAHRLWEENVCQQAGLVAHLPLWQIDRQQILSDWWRLGFEARLVVARQGVVAQKYLGKVLDPAMAVELTAQGIDACGENGEFHTLVTAGPLFSVPLAYTLGRQVLRSDCWFQDVLVANP